MGSGGQTTLDTASLLPLIGILKYADEVGTLVKGTKKVENFKVDKIVKTGEKRYKW